MNIHRLNTILNDRDLLLEKIKEYLDEKIIQKIEIDDNQIKGHILKAKHNLKFVNDNIPSGYYDWCITGCYYAIYHAALSLIIIKGYNSKNHDATLCLLIKEYYKKINPEELELFNRIYLDYQEILFYVQSKQKREDASYSTQMKFDKTTVHELRLKSALFIDKVKEILDKSPNL